MVQVQKTEKPASSSGAKVSEPTTELPAQKMNSIVELLSQAEKAYALYQQAYGEVAEGYKKHEGQLEKVFEDDEKQANAVCKKAMAHAWKTREQAEQQAEEAHRKLADKARDTCLQSVDEAQRVRAESIEQARGNLTQGREQAWRIFQGQGTTKA